MSSTVYNRRNSAARAVIPFTPDEIEEMRALEVEDEKRRKAKDSKEKEARAQLLAYPSISTRALASYEDKMKIQTDDDGAGGGADGVISTILSESKKTKVFEVVPYFTVNILPSLIAVYGIMSLVYFGYRAAITLNHKNYYTLAFSIAFLIVEVVSFFATIIHYNNFSNITTNILQMTLPEILHRQQKDYPRVNVFLCCYKEPPHIVNKTLTDSIAMNYPPDRLNCTICDDSSNFQEVRGWQHVLGMQRAFLISLLGRAVVKDFSNAYNGVYGEYDDRADLLKSFTEAVSKTTKEAIESEVEWFVSLFLLNPWPRAGEPDATSGRVMDNDNERDLLQQLQDDENSPYRTFTEEDLEIIERCSIENLRRIWDGNNFFRPIVAATLFRRPHIKRLVQELNTSGRLRYLTPRAVEMSQYSVLLLGRDEPDDLVVSAGNVRLDFISTGEVVSPSCTYVRRRKPAVPHNKAGNINNALFNESTEADFEFLLLLDADQKPHPNFLQRTLPYFFSENGKNIAWIQTPQFFSNIFPIDDPLGHRNMEFYGPVMEGRGSEGCCPFVGTNAVFRRSALVEIGGIMYNSVTEDMYTGMKLHVAGYKSFYHNEVLAIGSAPVDIKETLEQRKRWAQGAVEIFSLTPWRFLLKKLGFRKTIYNLDSCIYPFLAPTAFFYALSPVLITFWTVPIVVSNPLLFIFIGGLPTMIVPRIIQYILLGAERPHEEGQSGQSLWISATDLWRGEQTFFGFAATNISAWHHGRKAIGRLIEKYNVRGNLATWNFSRDFLPKKQASTTGPASARPAARGPAKKMTEQTFRTSDKDVQVLKSSRLFIPNIVMFALCVIAIIHAAVDYNCHSDEVWLMIVVIGFAFSTLWHLWSFIPMALRTHENEWPYTSSYHAHNILLGCIAGMLVFLYSKIQLCIPGGN